MSRGQAARHKAVQGNTRLTHVVDAQVEEVVVVDHRGTVVVACLLGDFGQGGYIADHHTLTLASDEVEMPVEEKFRILEAHHTHR